MYYRIGLSEDVVDEDQGGERDQHFGDSKRSCSSVAGSAWERGARHLPWYRGLSRTSLKDDCLLRSTPLDLEMEES